MDTTYMDDPTDASKLLQREHELRVYTDTDWEKAQLLSTEAQNGKHQRPAKSPQRSDTTYLDGLRGLAALFVFIHHFIYAFTSEQTYGFGQDGRYHFVTFPFIRLLWSGGDAGVAVFFILSGYVLSVGSLRKLRSERIWEVRRGIISGILRRPIRLYFPPLAVSLFVALLLQVPGLMLADTFSKPQPTIWAEICNWWSSSIDYFSIFRNHVPGGYFYNSVVWTLPVELKGSILIYGTLMVLSLGLAGADRKVPLMMTVLIFTCAAIMLQMNWKWSMADFLLGMAVAIADVWPLRSGATMGGLETRSVLARVRLLSEASSITAKLIKAANAWLQRWMRRFAVLVAQVLPRWLCQRLFLRDSQVRPERAARHQSTAWMPNIAFVLGWYLLSEPSSPGHREKSLNTPGWRLLTHMIPLAYNDHDYFRYWHSWGALLVVWSLLRLPWLQRFFRTATLQFLGHISFMLYLVHFPFFRTLPGRLVSLFGGPTNDVVKGTFWDHKLAFPDTGPPGLSSRFCLCMTITLPLSMIIAKFGTVMIDQPSVRMGKSLTTFVGLDPASRNSHKELSLPT